MSEKIFTQEEAREETLKYFDGDELATDVFLKKYCLKNKEGSLLEKTPDDMHDRLASEFYRVEQKYPNPLSFSEIRDSLQGFNKIVPQGSPMYGMGNPRPVSLSNCSVIPAPQDNMASIMEAGKQMALLYKRRYGVGVDISHLRPEGTIVNNAAETSTGAWSFADFYSYVTRMVGQSSRRGALMITIDVKHPDVEKFIVMKSELNKVTGANVSVKISDEFMEAVESNGSFQLQWPVKSDNPSIVREVKAKELWKLICDTACKTAEPGVLMWDNICKFLPAHKYPYFTTTCTNPCSELPLSDYDACRLISINLTAFIRNPFGKESYFDFDEFNKTVRIGLRLNDDLVDLELEKIAQIINASEEESEKDFFQKFWDATHRGRRTGLGTHGLADALAMLTFKYDSDKAIQVIDQIYEMLRNSSYKESIELAKTRGCFPEFDWETEKECAFFDSFPEDIIRDMKKYGRRNISLLTCAPTGSVSIMSQTSSGIEPIFRLSYTRRRKQNHSDTDEQIDFVDDMGDGWIEYKVYHKLLSNFFMSSDTQEIPDYFVSSDQIDWKKRVEVQATMQRYIDHSISSTINFPKGTKSEEISKVYELGWKRGLKGITVYVEGSRTGVLISDDESKEETGVVYHNSPVRPDEIECDIHQVKIKGEDWTILFGLINGRPYEVMGGKSSKVSIPEEYTKGILTKRRNKTVPSRYDLKVNGFKIRDVVSMFDNPDSAVLTRMVSMSLRHGVKPSFIVEQLLKDTDASFASFSKVLARVLKGYIEDGTRVASGGSEGGLCVNDEPHQLIYQEGCVICSICGWTKC